MIIWWVELSYPFEDLRGTHAATCDPVVLVFLSQNQKCIESYEKDNKHIKYFLNFSASKRSRNSILDIFQQPFQYRF